MGKVSQIAYRCVLSCLLIPAMVIAVPAVVVMGVFGKEDEDEKRITELKTLIALWERRRARMMAVEKQMAAEEALLMSLKLELEQLLLRKRAKEFS